PVQRILPRVQQVGQALADDHHTLGTILIAVIEVASCDNRNAKGRKESRRNRAELRVVILSVISTSALCRKSEVNVQPAVIPPRRAEARRNVLHTRYCTHPPQHLTIEVLDLLIRLS